jgi:flagellar motility protein MotE (MotC chaperone)
MKLKALFAFLVGSVLAVATLSFTGVIPMASAQEDAEEQAEEDGAENAEEGEEVAEGEEAAEGEDGEEGGEPEPTPEELAEGNEIPPTEADLKDAEENAALEEDQLLEAACRPTDFAELKLLDALRKRDEELQLRARLLEEKENTLRRIEEELALKMDELRSRVVQMERRLELGDAELQAREERLNKLVSALRTLSAAKAAPILAEADTRFATRLLQGLGAERTGKLLAKMKPAKAARLMKQLANAQSPAQRAAN